MTDANGWQSEIDPAATAFFLDVDGTLLGFEDRPEDVVADADLLRALEALQKAAGGAVALVSGRMVDDLDRIMRPMLFTAGGTHGADLRWPDGRREALAGAELERVRSLVRSFVSSREGLRLEDKGAALAIHFRGAPQREGDVQRFLEDAIEGDALMVQHGKMVAEVKSSESSKGRAIEKLMDVPPFAGRVPLFIGDDLTDEHGFETVNALGGISIKVGPEPSIAHHRIADVTGVREFLANICRSAGPDL